MAPRWRQALVGAGGTLALALIAENMLANGDNGTIVGALALAIAVPSAFVAALGSLSASGGDGAPALRIAGWIGFGLAVVDAGYLLALGSSGAFVPPRVITSTGVLAALGIGALAADGFIRAGQAEDAGRRLALSLRSTAPTFVLVTHAGVQSASVAICSS